MVIDESDVLNESGGSKKAYSAEENKSKGIFEIEEIIEPHVDMVSKVELLICKFEPVLT